MPSDFWVGKRVLVTGGGGFLGSHVMDGLGRLGCAEAFAPRQADFDLRDVRAVTRLYQETRPDIVLHLAAVVGGIGANRARPAEFFYDNIMMGVQLMHEAWRSGVKKFVSLGSVCSYPKHTPVPFREEELWNGYPEETNAPYGLAKKMLLVQSQTYRQQYGFNAIFLLPVNIYGPRDHTDLETSHVIPALIRKCIDAQDRGDARITAWGSGEATREFLYVKDAAEGVLSAAERYDGGEAVNLGTGREIKIRDLMGLIARLTGFRGEIVWDKTKPDGQPRRCLDTSRAERLFGFRAATSFEEGLRETISWYREAKAPTRTDAPG